MQIAFAIRELVLLQEELERSASALGYAKWEAAPLVWYFSYRSEQWRLHMAFPRPHGDTGAVVNCAFSPFYRGRYYGTYLRDRSANPLAQGCSEALECRYTR